MTQDRGRFSVLMIEDTEPSSVFFPGEVIQFSSRIKLLHHKRRNYTVLQKVSCKRKYYAEGLSCREIAIGRSFGTISREIDRNRTHMYDISKYDPHIAQKRYLLCCSYYYRGVFRFQRAISCIEGNNPHGLRSKLHALPAPMPCRVSEQSADGSATDIFLTGAKRSCIHHERKFFQNILCFSVF